jgi:tRNA1(Val) A37 N6-methylase TrmN6
MAAGNLTNDAFLNGRIHVLQPARGFRSGLDAVMLASAVPARERQNVCELGAGVGVASLCLAHRVAELQTTVVEIDPELLELAVRNFRQNKLSGKLEAVAADILKRPKLIPRQHFHHIFSNPPFHDAQKGTVAPGLQKATAKSISTDALEAWLRFARAIVRPKGTVTVILPPAQLPSALQTLTRAGLGASITPLWPKALEPAKRVILCVQVNSNAPLRLNPGIILHDERGRPTGAAEEILREGKPLTT